MRVVLPAGGVGAARFLRGLLALGRQRRLDLDVTVVGNTGDDITLHGLRVCPDLDTVMYTLGDGIEESQGWGRHGETFAVGAELRAYGAGPDWFTLGDRDLATHLVRTEMLAAGYPLGAVTAALATRWRLPEQGVRLLPMSDDRVETHVVVDDGPAGRRAIHFQEWWVRRHAEPPAHAFVFVGIEAARPAPGVLDAIAAADLVLLPPSNPVVSIGPVLAVEGIRDALLRASAPVVGVSPIVGGKPVRGMADRTLPALGVGVAADAVAMHYGARGHGGLLDGWVVDETDADSCEALRANGIPTVAAPALMTSVTAAARLAGVVVDLARDVAGIR